MATVTARYDTVSFLSDLGTSDEFVGVVKSVVRDLAPHATVIDLTHDVPPFDVRAGSLALARSIPYVAAGVVLAVVDPGTGTDRRAVAIEVADGAGVIVGPDNGLLAPAVALAGGAGRCVVLDDPSHHLVAPGTTCSPRDIFAPVVAALCNGTDLEALGSRIEADQLLPGLVPVPREENGSLHGEITWIDRFGNCQLNVGPDDVAVWGDRIRLTLGDSVRSVPVVAAFADLGAGAPGLVIDSNGMLAVALDRASASFELGLHVGDSVVLGPGDGDALTTPVRLTPRA
jgi:S-adenosyl-L-methionine hydrolase (adenosine-forming)